jgi:hypothetical protein
VRNYLADSRLLATADYRDLTFDGRTSALGAALKTLVERHRGQPLAGVVLLTDGVASDLEGMIWPVATGLPGALRQRQPPRDIGIVIPPSPRLRSKTRPLLSR